MPERLKVRIKVRVLKDKEEPGGKCVFLDNRGVVGFRVGAGNATLALVNDLMKAYQKAFVTDA